MRVRLFAIAALGLLLIACAPATDANTQPAAAPTVQPAANTITPPAPTDPPAGESAIVAEPDPTDPPPTAEDASTPRPVGEFDVFPVAPSIGPHDVAPAPDGRVWFTGQHSGDMGLLDPATGSEERRVGKECRAGWWRDHEQKDIEAERTRRDELEVGKSSCSGWMGGA